MHYEKGYHSAASINALIGMIVDIGQRKAILMLQKV